MPIYERLSHLALLYLDHCALGRVSDRRSWRHFEGVGLGEDPSQRLAVI